MKSEKIEMFFVFIGISFIIFLCGPIIFWLIEYASKEWLKILGVR